MYSYLFIYVYWLHDSNLKNQTLGVGLVNPTPSNNFIMKYKGLDHVVDLPLFFMHLLYFVHFLLDDDFLMCWFFSKYFIVGSNCLHSGSILGLSSILTFIYFMHVLIIITMLIMTLVYSL